jgi:hypothetical protein
MFFLTFIWLAFVVFILAAYWKIYEKAGQPGWAAIIPIYDNSRPKALLLNDIKKAVR